MASVNKVILVGNIGSDVELKQAGETPVVNISVATQRFKKDQEKETDWHRVVVFGKQAENCSQYLQKGSPIYVEGRIQTRSYEKDGNNVYVTEIIASNVQFLGKPSEDKTSNNDNLPF